MRRNQGRISGVSGVGPIEGPSSVARVRALRAISPLSRYAPSASGYTFAEAMQRSQLGLTRAAPLEFGPIRERPPLPPGPDDELELSVEAPANSFLGRLLRKIGG